MLPQDVEPVAAINVGRQGQQSSGRPAVRFKSPETGWAVLREVAHILGTGGLEDSRGFLVTATKLQVPAGDHTFIPGMMWLLWNPSICHQNKRCSDLKRSLCNSMWRLT